MNRYRLHGLTVASEVPLAGRPAPPDGPTDFSLVRVPDQEVPSTVPPGVPLVLLDDPAAPQQAVLEVADGWLIWFPCAALVHLSRDLRTGHAALDPGFDPGVFEVLASGFVLSVLLQLRGEVVLHASAVEVEAAAWAVVAPSGGGKSTLATLLCRDGAGLVSDDVLRVTSLDGHFDVWRGPSSTRLRPAAAELALGRTSSTTADGRTSVTLAPAGEERAPLHVLLLPAPDRSSRDLEVVRVLGAQALLSLISAPRVLGWVDPAHLRQQLAASSALAARVPVLRVRVPWGPPFREGLGTELRRAVQTELASSSPAPVSTA